MTEHKWTAGQQVVLNRQLVLTIKRVTPSGRAVLENGVSFRPSGIQVNGDHWHPNQIEPLTPEIETYMRDAARTAQASSAMVDAIEQAERMIAAIHGWIGDKS